MAGKLKVFSVNVDQPQAALDLFADDVNRFRSDKVSDIYWFQSPTTNGPILTAVVTWEE